MPPHLIRGWGGGGGGVLLNCGLQTAEAAEPPEPSEPIFSFLSKKLPKDKLFLKHLIIKKLQ